MQRCISAPGEMAPREGTTQFGHRDAHKKKINNTEYKPVVPTTQSQRNKTNNVATRTTEIHSPRIEIEYLQ